MPRQIDLTYTLPTAREKADSKKHLSEQRSETVAQRHATAAELEYGRKLACSQHDSLRKVVAAIHGGPCRDVLKLMRSIHSQQKILEGIKPGQKKQRAAVAKKIRTLQAEVFHTQRGKASGLLDQLHPHLLHKVLSKVGVDTGLLTAVMSCQRLNGAITEHREDLTALALETGVFIHPTTTLQWSAVLHACETGLAVVDGQVKVFTTAGLHTGLHPGIEVKQTAHSTCRGLLHCLASHGGAHTLTSASGVQRSLSRLVSVRFSSPVYDKGYTAAWVYEGENHRDEVKPEIWLAHSVLNDHAGVGDRLLSDFDFRQLGDAGPCDRWVEFTFHQHQVALTHYEVYMPDGLSGPVLHHPSCVMMEAKMGDDEWVQVEQAAATDRAAFLVPCKMRQAGRPTGQRRIWADEGCVMRQLHPDELVYSSCVRLRMDVLTIRNIELYGHIRSR